MNNNREIPVEGVMVIVSESDYDWLIKYKWRLSKDGYAYTGSNRTGMMHRLIMGDNPGFVTDHKNRIRHDNSRENLRWATAEQNARNCAGRQSSKSKYKGVNWDNTTGKWRPLLSYLDESKKRIWLQLGIYDNEKDAALAYDKAARPIHKEFGFYNFPEAESDAFEFNIRKTSSIYKGVCLIKDDIWQSYFGGGSIKAIQLGHYASEKDAALARDKHIRDNGIDKLLNFPDISDYSHLVNLIEPRLIGVYAYGYRYKVYVKNNDDVITLPDSYEDKTHAAMAYDREARKLGLDLNFPDIDDYSEIVPWIAKKPISGYWGVYRHGDRWLGGINIEKSVDRFEDIIHAALAHDRDVRSADLDEELNFPEINDYSNIVKYIDKPSASTGYWGVQLDDRKGLIRYDVSYAGKRVGIYKDLNMAALAYDKAARADNNISKLNYPDNYDYTGIILISEPEYDQIVKGNRSKYIGIHKSKNLWLCCVRVKDKTVHRSSYLLEEQAALAWDKYITDNSLNRKLNFPEISDYSGLVAYDPNSEAIMSAKMEKIVTSRKLDAKFGYIGIIKRRENRFGASVYVNRKTIASSTSYSALEAAISRDDLVKQYNLPDYMLNFNNDEERDIKRIEAATIKQNILDMEAIEKQELIDNKNNSDKIVYAKSLKTKHGYNGIYYNKRDNIWHARIHKNNKNISSKSFKSIHEAAREYDRLSLINGVNLNKLNFKDSLANLIDSL